MQNREIRLLQQLWEVLLAANAPSKGASYSTLLRFVYAVEGLYSSLGNQKDCCRLFADFKPLYHNRLKNGSKLKLLQ